MRCSIFWISEIPLANTLSKIDANSMIVVCCFLHSSIFMAHKFDKQYYVFVIDHDLGLIDIEYQLIRMYGRMDRPIH